MLLKEKTQEQVLEVKLTTSEQRQKRQEEKIQIEQGRAIATIQMLHLILKLEFLTLTLGQKEALEALED